MIDLASQRTYDSAVCEGVRFTIRTINLAERGKIALRCAEAASQQDQIVSEMRPLEDPEAKDPKPLPAHETEWKRLNLQWIGLENSVMMPAQIEPALVSIEGITIDGEDAPVGELLTVIPDELTVEIYEAVQTHSRLTEDESKNLSSPGTSAGRKDGETINTTAESVESEDSMNRETVGAISLAS
jgi:hypothetical protein